MRSRREERIYLYWAPSITIGISFWALAAYSTLEITVPAITAAVLFWLGFLSQLGFKNTDYKMRFLEKQFYDLYAPLLGCRKIIVAQGYLEHELNETYDREWREKDSMEIEAAIKNPEISHKKVETLKKQSEILNELFIMGGDEKFKNLTLPKYQEMRELVSENFALAEKPLQDSLIVLNRFVGIWEEYYSDRPTPDVNTREKDLKPMYLHIEQRCGYLVNILNLDASAFSEFKEPQPPEE